MELNMELDMKKKMLEVMQSSSSYMERDDCLVRSLAMVADISYETAHTVCELAGRPKGKGWYLRRCAQTAKELGIKVESFDLYSYQVSKKVRRVSISTFLRDNPKGRFWVARRGHALAIIDGKMYGEGNNRRFLVDAYSVSL